jgi:hypothetical protein
MAMKQSALTLVILILSCNNSGDSYGNEKDSLDSISRSQKQVIDSAADKAREQVDSIEKQGKKMIDSTTAAKKAQLRRQDSLKKKK